MKLGAFSVSLAVKDIKASRAFYETLGFEHVHGDEAQNWLILRNGDTVIGLFQGMFEKNILTFNPGWTQQTETLEEFEDVRAIKERLRAAGHVCDIISVGSTPTAHFAERLDGVTEVRAGVHVFMDLVMAGLGVCDLDDIALSVLTEVIGCRELSGGEWLIDAGWMALSRDRGTAGQALDQGYGLVLDADGNILEDIIVRACNQEHGIVARRDGTPLAPDFFTIGQRLRILPNHACATAAQHDGYWLLPADDQPMRWLDRIRGW